MIRSDLKYRTDFLPPLTYIQADIPVFLREGAIKATTLERLFNYDRWSQDGDHGQGRKSQGQAGRRQGGVEEAGYSEEGGTSGPLPDPHHVQEPDKERLKELD